MDNTNKQLEKVEKLFGMINEEYVKPEEVIQLFEALSVAIKDIKRQLEQLIADNKGEIANDLKDVLADLKTKELRLESLITQSKEFSLVEVRKVAEQFNQEVNRIEALIPTIPESVDLAPLERKIEEVEKKIPEKLTKKERAVQSRDDLEFLKGDERLDISAIKGLGKRLSKLTDEIINRAIGILDQRTSFLINKVSETSAKVVTILGNYIIGDGVRKITVGPTAPVNPAVGDLWVDTTP